VLCSFETLWYMMPSRMCSLRHILHTLLAFSSVTLFITEIYWNIGTTTTEVSWNELQHQLTQTSEWKKLSVSQAEDSTRWNCARCLRNFQVPTTQTMNVIRHFKIL
jgi:hypothetical protein